MVSNLHNVVRDLRFNIPSLGIDDNLSSYGIDLIELDIPTHSIEVSLHEVPGKPGNIIGRPEIRGSDIKLIVQFNADNKLEYLDKLDNLRYLFSQPQPMVLTLKESYSKMYEFNKLGGIPEGVKQFYDRFHVDVTPSGKIIETRDGLRGRFEISMIFTDVPYRYKSKNITNLEFPTTASGTTRTYTIFNNGNVEQNSRQFYSLLEMTNLNTKGFDMETFGYKNGEKSTGQFKYSGNLHLADVSTYNGYMFSVNGVKNMKNTNYGKLVIEPGNNKLVIKTTNNTVIKGFFEFKEYIY